MTEETKTCKDCGVEYPKTSEFFNRNTNKKYLKPCCKDCEKIRNRKYRKDNKERLAKYDRGYRLSNIEKKKEYDRKYKSSPEYKKKRNERSRKRRKEDPAFKLRENVSRIVRHYLLKDGGIKSNPTWNTLPYTPQDLREHLENHPEWQDWMTWENYGNGEGCWNVDHIIPQSKLPYDSLEHPNFLKCWSLSNLRPLCSIENISKGNRMEAQ